MPSLKHVALAVVAFVVGLALTLPVLLVAPEQGAQTSTTTIIVPAPWIQPAPIQTATQTQINVAASLEVDVTQYKPPRTFSSIGELRAYLRSLAAVKSFESSTLGVRVEFVALAAAASTLDSRIAGAVTPVAAVTSTLTTSGTTASQAEYSRTNVQVEGVDELDYAKTDGRIIAVASGSRVFIVDPSGRSVASKIEFAGRSAVGVFLYRRLLIAVSVDGGNTYLAVFNVSDPSAPEKVFEVSVSGRALTGRLVDRYLYLVAVQPIAGEVVPALNGSPLQASSIVLADSRPDTYTNILAVDLDKFEYEAYSVMTGPSSWVYMKPGKLYIASVLEPKIFEAYLELCRISATLLPSEASNALMEEINRGNAAGCIDLLRSYMANLPDEDRGRLIEKLNAEIREYRASPITRFTVFEVDGIRLAKPKIFEVEGRLLDQFSMEEWNGVFIVATTSWNMTLWPYIYTWTPPQQPSAEGRATIYVCRGSSCTPVEIAVQPSAKPAETRTEIYIWVSIVSIGEWENNVYIFNASDYTLIGSIRGLAKGERIYAARLVGSIFYLVTFRQVDPLFAIDVSDPENPKVLGFLKMPGFSEYLHPVAPGRLLGVGLEGTNLKVALFDVSDPKSMSIVAEIKVGGHCSSPLLSDHHAFTYDEKRSTAYIPVACTSPALSGILAVGVSSDSLTYRAFLQHEGASRTLYIGGEVFTVSPSLIKVFNTSDYRFEAQIELK